MQRGDEGYWDYWQIHGGVLPALRHRQHPVELGRELLTITDMSLMFGGIRAISGVNLRVCAGQIHSLIGPNGAGKTSVINCISGVYRPQTGVIRLAGRDLTRLAPHQVPAMGVSRTFQRLALFEHLSVLGNILVARHRFIKAGMARQVLGWRSAVREEASQVLVAEQIIEFLNLERVRDVPAAELSYGVCKRVEIGRALALEPSLLLLDEPVAGMNRDEKEDVVRCVLDLRTELGITFLLVEHEMDVVMDISDRITVMNFGEVIAEGTPAEVAAHPKVIEAYLGERGGRSRRDALA